MKKSILLALSLVFPTMGMTTDLVVYIPQQSCGDITQYQYDHDDGMTQYLSFLCRSDDGQMTGFSYMIPTEFTRPAWTVQHINSFTFVPKDTTRVTFENIGE